MSLFRQAFRYWLVLTVLGLTGYDRTIDPALNGQHVVQITTPLSGTLAVQDANGQVRNTLRSEEAIFLVFRLRNTGDSTVIIGPEPQSGRYRDLIHESGFFSLLRFTPDETFGKVIKGPLIQQTDPMSSGPTLVPPRSMAEWRIPWRDQAGTQYQMPVYSPAGSGGISRVYQRYDPNPEPLSPGLYRSAFSFDAGGRRAPFSITFQVE